ncbi:hypothetical protein PG999_003998 [Apiospora kogelbergensis]|uniref:Uncharacterized protein n=1 Tax=Apiospora kogelbergensis TaxID=1337665 RepID=A0AAW0R523_9PEZI
MPGNSGQKTKKQGKSKSKPKSAMLQRYIHESGSALEEASGSSSMVQEDHVARAGKSIAAFDQAWAHASKSSNNQD